VSEAEAERVRAILPQVPVYPAFQPTVAREMALPKKLSAAYLIEQAGLKGLNWSEVGVSAQHALVLVRHHAGSGEAILALTRHIQTEVFERFGVLLEPEPLVWPILSTVTE
jgi:UDP-N-acetylmuramate dehydrogenase